MTAISETLQVPGVPGESPHLMLWLLMCALPQSTHFMHQTSRKEVSEAGHRVDSHSGRGVAVSSAGEATSPPEPPPLPPVTSISGFAQTVFLHMENHFLKLLISNISESML